MVMALATNVVAAAWLAVSIAFYVFVYTMWLKRRTPQNIVIGGAAGAFPPIIGWAAVTGHVAACRCCCSRIVFLWTPPHFLGARAVCLQGLRPGRRADAARRGRGPAHAAADPALHGGAAPVSVLPWSLGYAGRLYGLTAAALGAAFMLSAALVWLDKQDATGVSLTKDAPARATFRYSLAYLAILFAAVAVDHFVG